MRDLLLKRWFLVLLLVGVGSACLRPEWLQPITRQLEPQIIVATALFLIAWSLESRTLLRSVLRPMPALWAVLISYSVVPALGWLAGWILPDPDLRVGLLVIASVPCTLASAVLWTRMAGGNEATALLAILLTTAASWLVTTTWLAWAVGSAVPVDSSSMMTGLALVLMVPVGLGQLCHTLGPLARAPVRFKAVLTMVSQLLIFCIIVKAAVDVSQKVGEKTAAVSAGAFVLAGAVSIGTHLAALGIGLGSSRLLGFDRPSQIAVAFSCSQKTLPVALYLFDRYFKEAYPLAVLPIVLYHVGQLVADTFVADALAKGEPTIVNPVALPSTKRSCS